MAEGWFKIHRSMLDHPVLQDPVRFRAWCWLLSEAAWKDTRKDIKGKTVVIKRGQVAHSIRFLATAWGCSTTAVQRLLTRLRVEQMIVTASHTGQTVITICNYDKYQDQEAEPVTPTVTGASQERHKLEEGKKERTSTASNTETPLERDSTTSTVDQTEFDQFWNEVPRKIGKGQARRAYKAARKKASGLEILAGMKAFARQSAGKDPKFVCHPATWLNGERWLDEEPQQHRAPEGKSLWEQAGEELNA